MRTDKERIDYLDSLTGKDQYGGMVVCRMSTTGRGWGLHETTKDWNPESSKTVREAIDQMMEER